MIEKGEDMTKREICQSYRCAKNKERQIQVLAELNGVSKLEIIKILAQEKEELPKRTVNSLFKKLDRIEEQIREKNREYREIAAVLKGEL